MRKSRQQLDENIIKLLSMAKQIESDYSFWAAWLRGVASCLYVEHKFEEVIRENNKEVFANLNGLTKIKDWDRSNALKWCSDTYDVHHPLRFAVETLDSIEEVRLFLEPMKPKNIGLHNLVRLKNKTQWEVVNHEKSN